MTQKSISTALLQAFERFANAPQSSSQYLPSSALTAMRFAKPLIIILAGFTLAISIWACFASADKIVTGTGVVRPAGNVRVVNHVIGGRIAKIMVKNGDKVAAGDLLASFDPVTLREEIKQRQLALDNALAEAARLSAEADNAAQIVFPESLSETATATIAAEQRLFAERKASFALEQQALESTIAKHAAQAQQYASKIKNITKQLQLAKKQLAAVSTLEAKGYYPKMRVMQVQRDVLRLGAELDDSKGQAATHRAAKQEAEAALALKQSQRRAGILEQLSKARASVRQLTSEREQYANQFENLDLRAPVAGFIEELSITNAGQAVRAGQAILHIVPEAADYIIDVAISNRDIALLKPEQPVMLKLHAYDYSRFGKLDGRIWRIAHDGTVDKANGALTFTVQIKPKKAYLGDDPARNRIHAGMSVDADILISKRSIANYLIDAIIRSTDHAFND